LALFSVSIFSGCGGGNNVGNNPGNNPPADPIISLPKTGQTTSYAAGDDGDLQKGAAWPNPRFTTNNDVITDNLTGLIWVRDSNLMATRDGSFDSDDTAGDGIVTWQHALDYVSKLNTDNYSGYNDWRLPNINELESLCNAGVLSNRDWLVTQGFIGTGASFKGYQYWSSSTYQPNSTLAWLFEINSGRVTFGFKNTNYMNVLPVRSSTVSLPKTGQQTSYSPGDDGALQQGLNWPANRFQVNSAQTTVTDNLTGLIWIKNANLMVTRDPDFDQDDTVNDGQVFWEHALAYIKKLNDENYLGSNDWRLPNRKEIRSLINYEYTDQAVCLNANGFSNFQSPLAKYWSGTTWADNTTTAYTQTMYGHLEPSLKSYTLELNGFVIAVRGGK
jgi:hypothetical protein